MVRRVERSSMEIEELARMIKRSSRREASASKRNPGSQSEFPRHLSVPI
jgi:hypothetical protein